LGMMPTRQYISFMLFLWQHKIAPFFHLTDLEDAVVTSNAVATATAVRMRRTCTISSPEVA
jgi:hypothetical protein